MKKLLFAIAGAASFAALAADPAARSGDISLVGFEGYAVNTTNVVGYGDNGVLGDNSRWSSTGEDASYIRAYSGTANATTESIAAPTNLSFPPPFEDEGDQYLALDTNGSELRRAIPADGQAIAADGTYIDTLVQFTPSESAPTDTDLAGAKLAIWLGVDPDNNTTNLMVAGGAYSAESTDDEDITVTAKSYKLSGTYEANTWYRLTVKAINSIADADWTGSNYPGFEICIDGTPLTVVDDQVYDATALAWFADGVITDTSILTGGTFIPSAATALSIDAPTLTSVGFKGTGAIDDFVVTTETPVPGPATIDFTLTWPNGYTPVSYQIGDGETVSLTGESSPFSVPGLAAGDVVKFVVANADGAQKTLTGTAGTDTGLNATNETFGWPEYLGEAVAGAYTIDDFADLDMLRKGVAAGLTTANETFKQTADIDMTSAGAFAGIGAYSKVPTAGTPFLGTYDGQGFTIANVQRADGDTQGIFNQVGPSGVIENLVVSNMYWDSELSGEYGFAIVGNAGGGATLRNLTAAGEFASATKPSTHNIAGIAVRLSPGATAGAATTVDSCTNNATIYGAYTKMGGINAIVQNQTGFVDGKVVFVNCANNGTLVCKRTAAQCAELDDKGNPKSVTGNAGIVGYFAGTNVELTGCYGNGVITNEDGANTDCDGALVGTAHSGTLADNGGNSAPANAKMVGKYNTATVTGFQYATVDNGVATTVTTLAKDTTYLLEGNVAASETPVFTLAAAGDTIAFDAALGYTFAGTIAAGEGLKASAETVDTVTTYTAAALAKPTVTVTGGANATAVWTVNGEVVAAPTTLTEGDTYSVAYTANQGYEFAAGAVTSASGTAGTENIVITIDDATKVGGAEFDTDADDLLDAETTVTADDVASYVASVRGEAAPAVVTKPMVVSYLLNANKILATPETEVLKITAIEQVTGGWKITVAAALNAADVAAGATVNLNNITGALKVTATADLGTAFAPVAQSAFSVSEGANGAATITVTDANAKFLKATVTK